MAATVEIYQRPLKKSRLGIPDIYPQEPKQGEDDLSEKNVKYGFNNKQVVTNEHGSADSAFGEVHLSKFAQQYNKILHLKQKVNTFQDTRKKLQLNKDNFWHFTARSKPQLQAWLQDLAGNKPLSQMAKKVPIFNKKDEIMGYLAEYNVPLFRATWFLKMTNASQQSNISDSKMKKRQGFDPFIEWTQTIMKFLKENIQKLSDYYTQPYSNLNQRAPPEVEVTIKNWSYGILLSEWMMEENLLDKHEFFHWAIDLIDCYKLGNDDVLFKHVLPFLLRHLETIVRSQILARLICTHAIKKLNVLNSNAENMQSFKDDDQIAQEIKANTLAGNTSPLLPMFTEYKECRQHHIIVTILTAIIQVVTLRCPTALIYSIAKMPSPTDTTKSQIVGSPLDKLPCFPSELILDPHLENEDEDKQKSNMEIKMSMSDVESDIQKRSIAVEKRWLSPCNQSIKSVDESHYVLDILDQMNFNEANSTGIGEAVHEAVFMNKDGLDVSEDQFDADKPTILLLCQWATSKMRHGKHRSLIVASVIRLRQNYLAEKISEGPQVEEETEVNTTYPYQEVLLEFLDSYTPPPDFHSCQHDESFQQLVLLFGELIRFDVFSHDEYLCTLVSRGDLSPTTLQKMSNSVSKEKKKVVSELQPSLVPSVSRYGGETPRFELDSEFMDPHCDLQNILIGTPIQETAPPLFGMLTSSPSPTATMTSSPVDKLDKPERHTDSERHVLNALHFPIPPGDDNSHDNNQRLVLLFGVGKGRQEEVKRVNDIVDLLNYLFDLNGNYGQKRNVGMSEMMLKSTMDIDDKKADVLRRFRNLSIHDQCSISSKFCLTIQDLKRQSQSNYGVCCDFPSSHQISLLLDLLEISENIQMLIDFIAHLVSPREHAVSRTESATYVNCRKPDKLLLVVAMIRKYYSCVLNSSEVTGTIFRGLLQTVENIADPAICHSTERCVLVMLHDMYDTCLHLKHRFSDIFNIASSKINDAICASLQPASTSQHWDPPFMNEYFKEPRKLKLDPIWKERLSNDRQPDLYSFVCNAVLAVCKCKDIERLYDISLVCCEATSHVSGLCKEWLGIIKAVCCCSNKGLGYEDLVASIQIREPKVQQSLSFFVCVLIAHHCMNLNDFLQKVAIPALEVSPSKDTQSMIGIRLTCMILEQLLEDHMDYTEQSKTALFTFRHEHYLLVGELSKVSIEDVMLVLKRLLIVAEYAPPPPLQNLDDSHNDEVFESLFNSESINLSQNSELFDAPFTEKKISGVTEHEPSLSKVVNNCLYFISSKSWMQQKILRNEFKQLVLQGLVDPELKPYQVQNFTSILINKLPNKATQFEDHQQATNRICKSLDKWSLHHACLEMQLLIKLTNKEETSRLLSAIGRAVISTLTDDQENVSNTSLICPLVSKLSSNIQAKILKCASETMEKGKWWNPSGNTKLTLTSQKTLFTLISTCLRGQEENKMMFLASLLKQFQAFVVAPEEEKIDVAPNESEVMLDAIQLRLNLVGMLFDLIMKTSSIIFDWTIALFQILSMEVVPPIEYNPNRSSLFTDLTDMIVILMQSIQLNDSVYQQTNQGTCEVQKFSSLIKKMRKELFNKGRTEVIIHCEELLPLHTPLCEIVTMEPIHPSDTSSQPNSATPLNKDKSEATEAQVEYGLKRTGIQFVNPWELLEGSKNPAPLSLSMFGAVKVEKRPLRYIEEAFRLIHHSHQKKKSLNYFLNASPEEEEEREAGTRSQTATPVATSSGPATPQTSQATLTQLLTSVCDTSSTTTVDQVIVEDPAKVVLTKQKQQVEQQRRVPGQKHTLSRSSSLPGSQLTEAKQRKLQLIGQANMTSDAAPNIRLTPTGAVASGHNDTTKAALQTLINNRNKMSATNVMQSVQQQQMNMQQQQSQNADRFNQQRAFSQVAPNVNISEALQSPSNSMTTSQRMNFKLQQAQRLQQMRQNQQMMNQTQSPSLHDLLRQQPMLTPQEQMMRETLLQQQQFQRMQLSSQSAQVQPRMTMAAQQPQMQQLPTGQIQPLQAAQIQPIQPQVQSQRNQQQTMMMRQMQMRGMPMQTGMANMQRQMSVPEDQFQQPMQAQPQPDMNMFQRQMSGNATEFQPQMIMAQQYPRQMQPGAQFPHQGPF